MNFHKNSVASGKITVWANRFSVYGTQKTVPLTQVSVYRTQKIFAHFWQNVEFSFRTQNQNSTSFQGFGM